MNYEPLTYFQFRKKFPYLNYLDYAKYLERYDADHKYREKFLTKYSNLKSE